MTWWSIVLNGFGLAKLATRLEVRANNPHFPQPPPLLCIFVPDMMTACRFECARTNTVEHP